MNVMRFVGRTSGEAMRKLRDALGPDALVLANRPCADGVELLAAAPGMLGSLESQADRAATPAAAPRSRPSDRPAAPTQGVERDARDGIAGEGAPPGPMSTVSFQDYVRQRLRERSQAGNRADDSAAGRPDPASGGREPQPRTTTGRVPADLLATQVDPACFELAGHMVFKRAVDFEGAGEGVVWRLLAAAAPGEADFAAICDVALGPVPADEVSE
jgi:flagellar biosynthesis GTPase FlhF